MLNELSATVNESVRNADKNSVRPVSSPYLKYAGDYLFTPEIGYFAMDVPAGENLTTTFHTSNSSVGFIFCLGGSMAFSITKNGLTYEYKLKQGEYSITYMPHATGSSVVDSRKRYRAVNMFVVPVRLRNHSFGYPQAEKLLSDLTDLSDDTVFLHKGTITGNSMQIIQELINTKASGFSYKNLDIAKLYEIIMQTVENLCSDRQSDFKNILQPEDIELLLNAGKILTDNLSSPPTLPALSKATGLNLFKLKNGFKEVFGTTVNKFVTEKRMEKAKLILESGKCSVSDAAWDLGYTNVSHFIELFRRHYGITPGKMLSKQRSQSAIKLIANARHSLT
jgi:AraC-like DNA-binding protein